MNFNTEDEEKLKNETQLFFVFTDLFNIVLKEEMGVFRYKRTLNSQ